VCDACAGILSFQDSLDANHPALEIFYNSCDAQVASSRSAPPMRQRMLRCVGGADVSMQMSGWASPTWRWGYAGIISFFLSFLRKLSIDNVGVGAWGLRGYPRNRCGPRVHIYHT